MEGVTESTPARRAVLHTNHGDITVDLFPDHAPKTVANFAELAEGSREWTDPRTREKTTDKLYDGTVFHRVIEGWRQRAVRHRATRFAGPHCSWEGVAADCRWPLLVAHTDWRQRTPEAAAPSGRPAADRSGAT